MAPGERRLGFLKADSPPPPHTPPQPLAFQEQGPTSSIIQNTTSPLAAAGRYGCVWASVSEKDKAFVCAEEKSRKGERGMERKKGRQAEWWGVGSFAASASLRILPHSELLNIL